MLQQTLLPRSSQNNTDPALPFGSVASDVAFVTWVRNSRW